MMRGAWFGTQNFAGKIVFTRIFILQVFTRSCVPAGGYKPTPKFHGIEGKREGGLT